MSETEPKWKIIQRVVAFLERSLTPDATVLHDVWLPDLVTGDERQCDVVITRGTPPREFTTLVEVQDRSSKVEPSTLAGWWEKKQAIGAHGLVCVSRLDFPQSVKNTVAKRYGPSVTLSFPDRNDPLGAR